jgi:hypothetical protein
MESVLFDILFNIVLGYVVARLVLWMFVKHMEAKLEVELHSLADRIVNEFLILATVEVDGNQYLCYNSNTNEFICQGVDLREIAVNFAARFPAKKLAIHNGDATAVETLNKQMEELKNENSSSV